MFKKGDKVKIETKELPKYDGKTGVIKKLDNNLEFPYLVVFKDLDVEWFTEEELILYPVLRELFGDMLNS
jgi:hypothetical protein